MLGGWDIRGMKWRAVWQEAGMTQGLGSQQRPVETSREPVSGVERSPLQEKPSRWAFANPKKGVRRRNCKYSALGLK